jgi:acyl-coenzyme A thioesterase 9
MLPLYLVQKGEKSEHRPKHSEETSKQESSNVKSSCFFWQVSNTFYFTFTLNPKDLEGNKEHLVRKVLPATEEEARNYLARYDADHLVINLYPILISCSY